MKYSSVKCIDKREDVVEDRTKLKNKFQTIYFLTVTKKLNQSRYKPGVAQRVPGS